MRRVFVPRAAWPDAPGTMTLDGPAHKHLAIVLRCRPGDALRLFDGEGREAQARVMAVDARRISVAVDAVDETPPASPPALILLQGIAKSERMDVIVQKATEIGATRIAPIVCARSVVRSSPGDRRVSRWDAIAREAARQSGQAHVPAVDAPTTLPRALDALTTSDGARFALWEEATEVPLASVLPVAGPVTLLVGPEGGFEPEEMALARRHDFTVTTLGPRILRTETAAIVALTLAQAARGGFA